MTCDVGEVMEKLENEFCWRMTCDVGEVTEKLENESNLSFASPMSQALHLGHLVSRPWYSIY